jgi:hypothetical protein
MLVSHLALQTASRHILEKLKKGSCASLSYQTTQGRNIPPKRTRIQIWANNPPNQKNWLVLLPFQRSSLFCSSFPHFSETHNCFLHACTPARRTRALALLFDQREHRQAQRTQDISFKKTFKMQKRWATTQAVPQVNRTALNTLLLVALLVLR